MVIIYSEDEEKNMVDFSGETITFTLLLLKKY